MDKAGAKPRDEIQNCPVDRWFDGHDLPASSPGSRERSRIGCVGECVGDENAP